MPPVKRNGTKILIVDDERAITDTLCMIFELHGFECMKAYNAEVALEMAHATPPDLLLTDVMLPRMNGIQLAIELGKSIPAMKAVLLSGQASTAQLLEDQKTFGREFEILAKPIHPMELIEYVSQRLNIQA